LRLLLDTHVLLWAVTQSERMPRKAWPLLEDESSPLVVSAVSIWEISIKFARRRGVSNDMPFSGAAALAETRAANFALLEITHDHAAALDALPLHHRDPFDRMLIAQAKSEGMVLLTHDAQLAAYGDCVRVV
jgi:PIN domain nuclease of toxin-antitoxin system